MSAAVPLVSVVTPVHNTGEYIAECMESVLNQTLLDLEYVVVDNQSTDDTLEIAQRYAARDSRVRVVRTRELLGQVPNYNFALSLISPQSRWCKMVQADDWIYPECLERMVAVGESDDDIAVVGSYHLFGDIVLFSGVPVGRSVHEGREVCRRQLRSRHYLMGNPTTLLYRSDRVRARSPFFAEDRFHEDTEVAFDLLDGAKLGFVHQVLSYVRVEEQSITGAWRGFDWFPALRYTMARHYGERFLAAPEQTRLVTDLTAEYWRLLVRAAVRLRGAAYFAFHRARLAETGEGLVSSVAWRWPARIIGGRLGRILRAVGRRLTPS